MPSGTRLRILNMPKRLSFVKSYQTAVYNVINEEYVLWQLQNGDGP